MTPALPPCEERAAVIGAGIAGLLAARVLADHYPQVVILERDRIPETPQPRTGVPQGHHVHALFGRGILAMEELLPGFGDALCARGGQRIDAGKDLVIATRHGHGRRFASDLQALGASRPLIEEVIREHVLALPSVHLLQRHRIDTLTGTSRHVTGVTATEHHTGHAFRLPAQLVVDAAGRGSPLPRWLAELRCPPVPETTVNAHVGYATRTYRRARTSHPPPWRACYSPPQGPTLTRGGVLAPLENDRWIATLTGIGADRPTSSDTEFLPFARTLATPLIADVLTDSAPLTPVIRSNSTANRRRFLHRATHLPDNLLVIGDSACAFDPIYAQGITVAALDATTLRACLTGPGAPRHSLAGRYHRRLNALHTPPWLLATTADLRFPDTQGQLRAHHRILGRYLDLVLAAGTRDRNAQAAFLNVLTMVRHPAFLLTPRVLLGAVASLRHDD
ncbi:NAD(P)/FAD-dependent oxidoreductase [Embleya sp. NPDC059237]|uniref:NAD(P)/FAD-dependent oxidoreductase n=1 Tax=Embleya sp. NPDC059237 TaxID=3346784 RepID=UPI0036C84C53